MAERAYHHGNLKEALLTAAERLIAERGTDGFTLLDAARSSGVSPAAPYRHYRDKAALVAEVARRGFETLSARIEAAWEGGRPDAGAAFARVAETYLGFSRALPGAFTAMFVGGGNGGVDCGREEQTTGVALLVNTLGALSTPETPGRGDACELAMQVWALSHGVATLERAGALPPGADPASLLRGGATRLLNRNRVAAGNADIGGTARAPTLPRPCCE